jgi:hypothetical protein
MWETPTLSTPLQRANLSESVNVHFTPTEMELNISIYVRVGETSYLVNVGNANSCEKYLTPSITLFRYVTSSGLKSTDDFTVATVGTSRIAGNHWLWQETPDTCVTESSVYWSINSPNAHAKGARNKQVKLIFWRSWAGVKVDLTLLHLISLSFTGRAFSWSHPSLFLHIDKSSSTKFIAGAHCNRSTAMHQFKFYQEH